MNLKTLLLFLTLICLGGTVQAGVMYSTWEGGMSQTADDVAPSPQSTLSDGPETCCGSNVALAQSVHIMADLSDRHIVDLDECSEPVALPRELLLPDQIPIELLKVPIELYYSTEVFRI